MDLDCYFYEKHTSFGLFHSSIDSCLDLSGSFKYFLGARGIELLISFSIQSSTLPYRPTVHSWFLSTTEDHSTYPTLKSNNRILRFT